MRTIELRGNQAPLNPRIYRKRIRRAEAGIRPGEVAAVRTADGGFVGRAFYSASSVIGARILDRDEHGPPVDAAWFARRLRAALALRRDTLRLDEVTDAYRVAHAEGDDLPALVVDRYGAIAVIEVGARGVFERLGELEEVVGELLEAEQVVVRAAPAAERAEGFSVADRHARPARTVVTEHGLRYHVDCRAGHKTGFFVDQREARREVARLAAGRSVLDLCCYTGGFTLAALKGGAREAVGVDLDEEAVSLARANASLNGLGGARFEHADAFDYLRAGARADLVVLDPPKLAAQRRLLGAAHRKSVDLNALALRAVRPGGLLFTFSCTGLFRAEDLLAQVREASVRAGRPARILRETGQPPDHPVHVHCPEGRYLSGLLLEVS